MTELMGQFGLSRIGGRTGWLIGLVLYLIGDGSTVSHAFLCIGDHVVEAMPGGAIVTPLSTYLGRPDVIWSAIPLTPDQQLAVATTAVSLVGTPYSFLDYLAIALDHWGIRPKRLRRYIADSGHLICSALVDQCYRSAGIHLFADGRDVGDVTPGDLANYLLRQIGKGACNE